MNIRIQPELPENFTEVFRLISASFGQEAEARLVENLRKNDQVFVPELSLVALVEHQLLGYILFSKICIERSDQTFVESLALAPMAVEPGYQKMGIGKQLVHTGLNKATALGFQSVIVLGHADYYPGFGFEPAIHWGIKAPFNVPDEVFMVMELKSHALKHASGVVRYPSEFKEL